MSILGGGVYSLSEAAKLTELRPKRVRDWFSRDGESRGNRAFLESDYHSIGADHAISFLDLVEVYIVGRLREADPPVSLQNIKRVHRKLSVETGRRHPFCSREIYHGNGQIFTVSLNDQAANSMIEPLTDQIYINDVIMPFLNRIEYDHVTNLAKLWRIAEGVVIDPARSFGKPIVEAVGIATRVLASAYEANGRELARVADWYEINPVHVQTAVLFENKAA